MGESSTPDPGGAKRARIVQYVGAAAVVIVVLILVVAGGGGSDGGDGPKLKRPESVATGIFAAPEGGSGVGSAADAGGSGGGSDSGAGDASAATAAGEPAASGNPAAQVPAGEGAPSAGNKVQGVSALTPEQQGELAAVAGALHALIRRTNAHDPDICTDLMTQRHVEEVTGVSGAAAIAKCRDDIAASTVRVRLNEIEGIRIEGVNALIQFTSSVGDYAKRQILRVLHTGGTWKFDGDGTNDV